MNKFLVGLILGIAIAGGVAFYLNSMPNQFENKAANRESGAIITNSGPLILAPGTKLQEFREKESKDNASTVNYDFYDILQGKKSADSMQNKTKENPEKNSTTYFVEAGAFDQESLAQDMKARLTLLGIDSSIKDQQIDNKVVKKVIIGPLDSEDRANQLIDRLSGEDISAEINSEKN
ncbi:MAG TPA: SPOR domain-containing protein [Burkholderiales bacterium]|nr:SPOR domain-containing protein [Burkholderiales bacterium]